MYYCVQLRSAHEISDTPLGYQLAHELLGYVEAVQNTPSPTATVRPPIDWRWAGLAGPLLFAAAMVASSTLFATPATVLPEIVAIAAGLWVYKMPMWRASPAFIALFFAGAAAAGWLINALALGYAVKVILAVAVVALTMLALRRAFAPAYAASLLPVVIDIHEPAFLIAVAVACAALYVAARVSGPLPQPAPGPAQAGHAGPPMFRPSLVAWHAVWVIAFSTAFSLLPAGAWVLLPPYVVMSFELFGARTAPLTRLARPLVAALAITALTALLLATLPWQLAALIALLATHFLVRGFALMAPPLYAIPLLAPVFPLGSLSFLASTVISVAAIALVLITQRLLARPKR